MSGFTQIAAAGPLLVALGICLLAGLQTIPGAGHLSNLERADEFNAIVGEFIGGLE